MWRVGFFLLVGCGDVLRIEVPAVLAASVDPTAVKSLEVWVLDQLGRDNTPIDCTALESHLLFPSDPNVQILTGPLHIDGAGPTAIKNIPNGNRNRIFYVDLYDQAQNRGTRIGAGCAGGQSIIGGKTVTIEVTVAPVSR